MAKLLHEDEYNKLIADRERLEWCMTHNVHFISRHDEILYTDDHGHYMSYKADDMREAIDKARGIK